MGFGGGAGEALATPTPVQRKGVRGELRRFGETTAVKGLKRVVVATHAGLRALWLVAVVVGLSMALYLVAMLCIRYAQYETITKLKEETSHTYFPDITVCPLQPLSLPLVPRPLQLKFFGRVAAMRRNAATRSISTLPTNASEAMLMEMFKQVATPAGLFESMYFSEEALMAAFHSMQLILPATQMKGWDWELLLQTQPQATAFHRLAIRPHISAFYYMCQTIQLPRGMESLRKDPVAVRAAALLLYADPGPVPALPFFAADLHQSRASGVRVVVHERDKVPNLKSGFSLSPGREATVRLKPVWRSRMGKPHGYCTLNHTIDGAPYTQGLCRELERQKVVMKNCGCFVGYLRFTKNMYRSGTPMCANFTEIMTNRLNEEEKLADFINTTSCAIKELNAGPIDPLLCPPRCAATSFKQTITQAAWPHPVHLFPFYMDIVNNSGLNRHAAYFREKYDDMMQRYASLTDDLSQLYDTTLDWQGASVINTSVESNLTEELEAVNKDMENIGLIQKSFMQLNVLFESEAVTNVIDQPDLTWEGLLASIGGALNLWIGVTFMTLIELFELFYHVVCVLAGSSSV